MKNVIKFFSSILILLLFTLFVGGVLHTTTSALMVFFASVDSTVKVAAITASTTIIISTFTIVYGKHLETRTTIQKEAREKKIPIYEELINFMMRTTMSGQPPNEKEVLTFMRGFTQRLMVWGADDVVTSWHLFRNTPSDKQHTQLFRYEDVVKAIRRDLGHKNSKFRKGTLLGLWINDIQDVVDPNRTTTDPSQ